MSAPVPYKRTRPRYEEVVISAPVRGRLWRELALLLHWCRAHGMHVIPAHAPMVRVPSSPSSKVLHYRIQPQGLAIARLWAIQLRLDASAGVSPETLVTFPNGDTATYFADAQTHDTGQRLFLETLSAKSAAVADLELEFEKVSGTADTDITSVSCWELPRAALTLDSTDLGVDLEGLRPGQAIYDSANRSLGAVAANFVSTWPRRQLIAKAFEEVTVDSASFVDVFTLGIPVIPRKEFRSDTARTLKWAVRGRSSDGSTPWEVRATTSSNGDSQTQAVAAGTTAAWRGNYDIDADCEDLSEDDGRPGGAWEDVQIALRRTGGSGTVHIESLSVWEDT